MLPGFDDLAVVEQPHALDRAALENCLGGPFHPGIEMTWVMRSASMWAAPFRLNVLPEDQPVVDDYGPILRPEVCLGPSAAAIQRAWVAYPLDARALANR